MHHFARQLGSPFPLFAAVGARTRRIEIGMTGKVLPFYGATGNAQAYGYWV